MLLKGAARKQRQRNGKLQDRTIAGAALRLRLLVAVVRDAEGQELARWRLWSKVEAAVSAETLARWHSWRWRIETFFKLLKRAGQHLEQGQQESALAIGKRRVVAAQALIIVWALMQAEGPAADQLRRFLIRLSGRLLKRGVAYTGPGFLAGMWNLLAIIDALERYSLAEVAHMARLLLESLGLADDFQGFKEPV